MNKLSTLLVSSILLLSCSKAQTSAERYAGIYDEVTLKQAHNTYSRIIHSTLYNDIAAYLTSDELKTLSKIRLEQPWQAVAPPFYFVSTPSKHLISIPTLSVKFFDDLSVAHTWLERFECRADAALDYVSALDLNAAVNKDILHSLSIPANAYEFDHFVNDVSQKTLSSQMTFILLHEFAHVHLQHKHFKEITSKQSLQQEMDADTFALEIMRRMHLPPSGMAIYFSAISYREPRNHKGYLSHPLSPERLHNIAGMLRHQPADFINRHKRQHINTESIIDIAGQLQAIADNLSDPDFRALIRRRGMRVRPGVLKKACDVAYYEQYWQQALAVTY